MGGGGSKEQKITLEQTNEAITNVISNQTNTEDIVISAGNTMGDITFGEHADISNCTIDLSQELRSNTDIYSTTKFKDLNDLKDKIKSALDTKIDDSEKVDQEAFATALNVEVDKNEIKSKGHDLVELNITSNLLKKLNDSIKATNVRGNVVFDGKCKDGTINMSQKIYQEHLVNTITDALAKNTGSTDQDSSQTGDSSDDSQTTQKGASDFARSVGDAISNIFKGPVVVICIAIVVLAILAFIFRKSISKIAERRTGVSFGSKIKKMINAVKKM